MPAQTEQQFPPKLSAWQVVWYGLRSIIFYIGYGLWTLLHGLLLALLVRFFGYRACVAIVNLWNRGVIVWLRLTCGVRYRVIGMDNVPPAPFVIVAKHQSQWETFFLQYPFAPVATILKIELLKVPVFGWGLKTVKPIAIDRSQRRESLRYIVEEGSRRLAEGISVLIFPEGTRTDPGKIGRYARGGADLAIRGQVPLLPIAHNAGECWPARRFIKIPGLVTVSIGAPIAWDDAADGKSLMTLAEHWIEAELPRVSQTPELYQTPATK